MKIQNNSIFNKSHDTQNIRIKKNIDNILEIAIFKSFKRFSKLKKITKCVSNSVLYILSPDNSSQPPPIYAYISCAVIGAFPSEILKVFFCTHGNKKLNFDNFSALIDYFFISQVEKTRLMFSFLVQLLINNGLNLIFYLFLKL